MKLTVDIVEDFIKTLDLSSVIISFSDDGTNTTLVVAETFHARKGMFATIDEERYRIIAVTFNESITIEGVLADPLTLNKFTLDNPFYFHGTPIMTNNHISQASENEKTPMVYLYEILKEKDNPPNDRVRREAETRFFFLDSANFNDWSTDEHYSNRLKGLNSLMDFFIEALKNNKQFYTFETQFNRTNHVNWGVFINDKGHTKRLFSDNLTGVELSFNLRVYDSCATPKVKPPITCAPATAIVQDQDGNELARQDIVSGATGIIPMNVGNTPLYIYPYDELNTGQDVSYATGDDKWVRDNVFTPEINSWPTDRPLVKPILSQTDPTKLLRGATPSGMNWFGNLERFTDNLGGQDYANGILIDHYLGEMIDTNIRGSGIDEWNNQLIYSNNLTKGGYTDWHMPNSHEGYLFMTYNGFEISPFNDSSAIDLFSSTTLKGESIRVRMFLLNRQNQSNSGASVNIYIVGKVVNKLTWSFRKAFTYDPNQDNTKLILT